MALKVIQYYKNIYTLHIREFLSTDLSITIQFTNNTMSKIRHLSFKIMIVQMTNKFLWQWNTQLLWVEIFLMRFIHSWLKIFKCWNSSLKVFFSLYPKWWKYQFEWSLLTLLRLMLRKIKNLDNFLSLLIYIALDIWIQLN
jgi:hypothetical protein